MLDLLRHPHRRYNPLTNEWVLVSPQRTDRPWQGQVEPVAPEKRPTYDPLCYLCPGNVRAGGAKNPQYRSTFVFENDFAALCAETPKGGTDEGGLIVAESERGLCQVLCFSPRHDLTLARMSVVEIRQVVNAWIRQYREIGGLDFINWVQIFENRGTQMGASNPHPHCQVWANQRAPNESEKEAFAQSDYLRRHNTCLLCNYAEIEAKSGERLVCENDGFSAVVPFWAIWPFETMLVSKRHMTGMDEFTGAECDALSDVLKRMTARYDELFRVSFPYSMGFHQRPTDGQAHPEWHFHAHFYPPLLRSATIRKFMVGYELLAMPQRDITPESAAERLRELPEHLPENG